MTDKPTVLVTNPMHPDGDALLAPHARMVIAPDTAPDTLRRLAHDADGIIVRAMMPEDICDHAPKLKGMVRHGVGLDFIPVEAATRAGVMVTNLPGCNTQAVTEYFFATLFRLRRPLGDIEAAMRRDGWNKARPMADATREVAGDTLGVIGVGAIGSRIARIAREAFGMTVIGVNKGPFPEGVAEVPLDELFRRSDTIAVTCALTDETRGLVNRHLIGLMKPDAVLINTSRGPVVETAALVDALAKGAIAGAAVDVYDSQPVPADSPLFACPRLLMTPHVAAITATSMRQMSLGAVAEMLRILRGERPLNLVNPTTFAA